MNNSSQKKINIGVLVSGNGSNLQAILDATCTDVLSEAAVSLVVSNKADAFALERARKAGVDALFLDPNGYESREQYYERVIQEFEKRDVQLVCLAGFLLKLEKNIIARYKDRILNIHPALLPKFGGKGMFGHHVHEAVLKAGEKESGCTVHIVDEEFDHGAVVLQKKVPVLPEDTPQSLAERVLKQEHQLYPEAIRLYIHKE